MNQLHLNTPKGIWTIVADLYAISLIVLALTGMFVLKGRTGISRYGFTYRTLMCFLHSFLKGWILFNPSTPGRP